MRKKVLVLTTACHTANHMFFESLGPLLPFLIVALSLSHAEAGRLGLIYYLVYGLFNYPSGHWSDRHGRRFFIMLFLLIASGSTLLMVFSNSYIQILILCGLAGLGGGLYHPAGTALLSENVAREERGRKLGIHAAGSSVGIIISYIIIGGVASYFNWKIALVCLSVLGFGLALYFRLFLWDVKDRVLEGKREPNKNAAAEDIPLWTLLKWMPYMIVLYGFVMFLFKGVYTWIPTYIQETYNLTAGRAIVFSVILPVIGIFSNYLMGRLSDSYGRKRSLVIIFSLLAVCFFLLYLGSRTFLIPILILMGFFINSFAGVVNAYLGDFIPAKILGRAFGIIFTFSICFSSLAPYVIGVISDYSSLTTSMLFMCAVSAGGALFSLRSPRKFEI